MQHLTPKESLQLNGLYTETRKIVIPANDTVENAINITAQRGDVKGVGITVAGGTDVQYSEVEFTLSDNGKSFNQKDNLLPYSPNYRFDKRSITPVLLKQNGELNYSFKNSGGTATMVVIITLFFYNPFDNSLR